MNRNNIILILSVFLLIFGLYLFQLKKVFFTSLIQNETPFFITKNMTYNELLHKLRQDYSVPNFVPFDSFCGKKKLRNFKPGKYLFKAGFSLNDIINELRVSGNRKAINFSFNSFDDFSYLASNLAAKTDIDSVIFMNTIYATHIHYQSILLLRQRYLF